MCDNRNLTIPIIFFLDMVARMDEFIALQLSKPLNQNIRITLLLLSHINSY